MALSVDFRVIQRQFFDRQKVQNAAERAADRQLAKAGAYIRRRARTSIRRRKRPSLPGQPPSAHAAGSSGFDAGLKFILFGKPGPGRVIVGPVGHRGGRSRVPQLMEKGGTVTYQEKRASQELADKLGLSEPWLVYGPRNPPPPNMPTRTRSVTIAPRPSMAPALEHVVQNELPTMLLGMIGADTHFGGGDSSVE